MKKKLIEVALPLDAINKACSREKSIRHGHPSTLHLWWARRPLAAARAVIFAQMVDDPSSYPDLFPTEKAQDNERQRLFKIIEDLVKWENTTNEEVLQQARDEIWQSWRRACAENADQPQADELFDRHKLPAFHDPFAGGGALPLEAQRLGLESYASDLNPVAVLINKAMIEIPPKFANQPPVNPTSRYGGAHHARTWKGAQGLAEDVRYYGQWMRDEAERRIGHLYPKVEVTAEMVKERPDLKPYLGQSLTVVAWIWARTVKSPNPAFAHVDVPLASTFMLSTKAGKEAYVQPVINEDGYRFTVKMGKPSDIEKAKKGTKLARGANFKCLMSDIPMTGDYIKSEGNSGRLGARLMAMVAVGARNRIYLTPTPDHETLALNTHPNWKPETSLPDDPRNFWAVQYGLTTYGDLFTSRELVALSTFSDLVQEVRTLVQSDAIQAGMADNSIPLNKDGNGGAAYADALAVYLGLAVSRTTNTINSLAVWSQSREQSVNLFSRQAIPMAWDYPEVNPFAGAAGDFGATTSAIGKTISNALSNPAQVFQADAQVQNISISKVISTDPPYYDNISYADLSDYFYVWQRNSLRSIFPELFATLAVPKVQELIATPYRHGSKNKAETFFLKGMTEAMRRLAEQAHPSFPVTIYYAFKQSENNGADGIKNTGWDTFLAALIHAGFTITGTWPMRTERPTGVKVSFNALASSIVLVCRKRPTEGTIATRRQFVATLQKELPEALTHLQRGNIAPVDLAQAAIGPGMGVYTRYQQVLDAEGKPLSVREALTLINQILDKTLAEQEGDFDADSRWAITWFDQHGFDEGEFGTAETLSKAKNTSVSGMVQAGIVESKAGKVRLLKPEELDAAWDPEKDERLTAWEMVHHLVRALESGGDQQSAELARKLGSKAEIARELCYRLYTLCERKKRASEALSYNALVQSFPEILRLAEEIAANQPRKPEQTSYI